ncbi:MAG TPA: hypothetical protein VJ983_05475 [candidate division Zixibacteria bacterium]|nr:hypothetical protein [candidate division Zixibacteria bacterium]
MKAMRLYLAVVGIMLLYPTLSSSETLTGRHQVGLNVGFWSQVTSSRTEIGIEGVTTSVKSGGTMGGFMYGHWLNEKAEITLGVSTLRATVRAETNVSGVSSETAVVAPVLIGMKRYIFVSQQTSSTRPFLSASVGMYVGNQTTTQVGNQIVTESRTEAALGGLAGGGVDFILSHRLIANVAVGYNLTTDFQNPIGGSKNYSGPQMTFGVSLLLGSAQSD